ncbi:hypothetical protein Q5752_004727 [Cryptotrichosporon argae]
MPSAPQPPVTRHAPAVRPPDPNRPHDRAAHVARSCVRAEPAPAVVATSSHVSLHVVPRRFIGGLPETVANSDASRAGRRRLREARARVVRRVRGEGEGNPGHGAGQSRRELREGGLGHDERGRARRAADHVRERLRGDEGESSEDDGEDEDGVQRRRDVWVGESFDVGREFEDVGMGKGKGRMPDFGLGHEGGDGAGADVSDNHPPRPSGQAQVGDTAGAGPSRPRAIARSTQETFVTARTELSASSSSLALPLNGEDASAKPLETPSDSPLQETGPRSIASSRRPLVPPDDETHSTPASLRQASHGKLRTRVDLAGKLKSVLRKDAHDVSSAATIHAAESAPAGAVDAHRPKTVQFPVDPVHTAADPDGPRRGNKPPAEPEAVLAREGEDAAGTSAGAVEDALEEEEEEEFGQVVMRDRMLVRVAHHREENLALFDEATERRTPCDRSERLEEYIVVMRRGRVEFYQDWKTPLVSRYRGKRLCFLVPLERGRSTLSVFNYTDLTLALTTSARKLHERVERLAASRRAGPLVARVRQSRQAQWLRNGKRGSHVFVLKIAERSRALDWFWAMWRALDGELPPRIDVAIPAFATTARLLVDEEDTRRMAPSRVAETIWDMMADSIDREALTRERELNLELVLHGADGSLDWLVWETDVAGHARHHALLASVAVGQSERRPHGLELRNASHQPRRLVLDDGAVLDEPPGVEGYLVRHKTDAAPKAHVYVSTHSGAVYVCGARDAHPPLRGGKKGSLPPDVFPDEYTAFVRGEHDRCARLVAHASGTVDLRDITSIEPHEHTRSFVVDLRGGHAARFEARSEADVREWIDALRSLGAYWTRRHRVDARVRMDAAQERDELVGAQLGNRSDAALAQVWDWCVIKGCREVTLAGRLFVKQGRWSTFRAAYVVLAGGSLVTFSVHQNQPFHRRHSRFPLFGAYVYSGMLAQDELREAVHEAAFAPSARVYQDGLQSTDGAEDTTFAVRIGWTRRARQPWDLADGEKWDSVKLSMQPPALLMCRARSKLERDRWVWAINAETERQTRRHVQHGQRWREHGAIPDA